MIEDKLSHDERLRLECLAQANICLPAASTVANAMHAICVVEAAILFERFVRANEEDRQWLLSLGLRL
ncbi:MAG TPA: hypothetical protein VFN61_04470 [Acidimicrobiales bacterium]|nr:hypothetical protein [Acidimicrobiales bacterium]